MNAMGICPNGVSPLSTAVNSCRSSSRCGGFPSISTPSSSSSSCSQSSFLGKSFHNRSSQHGDMASSPSSSSTKEMPRCRAASIRSSSRNHHEERSSVNGSRRSLGWGAAAERARRPASLFESVVCQAQQAPENVAARSPKKSGKNGDEDILIGHDRLSKVPVSNIRNFTIIAHIDHGKSTLAEKLLPKTGTVQDREMKEQFLDSVDLEKERGITSKLQSARLRYGDKDGLANQVLNKTGLPGADPDRVAKEIEETIGLDCSESIQCSAKEGIGIGEILQAVIDKVPAPKDTAAEPSRVLISDRFPVLREASGKLQLNDTVLKERLEQEYNLDTAWADVDVGATRTTVFGEEWIGRILVAVPGFVGLNLSGPQSVLEALGVLAAIITVHEAGHFLAARLQNIHVSKFAIGFGPTLARYHQKGVEYSLRAFPFGGFVAFPDDDPNSEFSPDDPNLLKNRPLLDRALVISAGVIANIIFAYTVLFVQTLGVGILERELFPGVIVPEVISKSAAANAGMQVGDVVVAVNGYQLSAQDSAVFQLVDTIKRSPGRPITLSVQRGQDVVGLRVTPDENRDGSGRIGVQLSPNARPHRVKAQNLFDAAVKSGREFGMLTATVLDGLKQILFNFEKTVDSVSGPVAIVAVGAEVARSDISGLYQFAAIVNINLAIVNLLPLPALDGGYLAFVLLEALRGGKKLPDGVEQGIMSSGVLLFLALGIVLMVRDTLNLGFVQQML